MSSFIVDFRRIHCSTIASLSSSCSQMVGNSAAVQANIAVPGMRGTRSPVFTDDATRNTRTAGVGYRQGESYAKWGRFACEMPASSIGRGHYTRGRVSPGKTSLTSPRRCPRSSGVGDLDVDMGQEHEYGIGGGSNGTSGADHADKIKDGGVTQPQQGKDGVEKIGGRGFARASYSPSARGGSAYLEVTV